MYKLKIFIILSLSFCLAGIAEQSKTSSRDPLTTIAFEAPVHFLGPDGSDLRIEPGTYAVEPAEEWIRLLSGARHDALLIEAKTGQHAMELEDQIAMSLPGESEDQLDNHYVMLLLPGGKSLEATGTYSGIRPRGLFNKAFNKVKAQAKRTYKKAKDLESASAEQLTNEFLKRQLQDPNQNPLSREQLQKQAQNMRKHATDLAKKKATHTRIQKRRAIARKHLHDVKRTIEKNARQAWKKARRTYANAKKRAGSAISVIKTPTPGGSMPIPYPNITHQKGTKRAGKGR